MTRMYYALKDLNPKSVDVECIPHLRKLKQGNPEKLTSEQLKDELEHFFVSQTEIEKITRGIEMIPGTIAELQAMAQTKGTYEVISLKRAWTALEEIDEPLKRNLEYAQAIHDFQETFVSEAYDIFQKIRNSESKDALMAQNSRMSAIFERILRNNETIIFNHADIVHEVHVSRLNTLAEMMDKGSFFHIAIDDYLKRKEFSSISYKIPLTEMNKMKDITSRINNIKISTDTAYELNKRMVQLAVVLYAHIRWLTQPN